MRAVAAHLGQIGLDHFAHQLIERNLVFPAELLPRFARVAEQRIGLGGPEIARIDFNQRAAVAGIDALFGDA